MTYLLIDNSNTRTKFVLSTPEALLKERRMIPTREVSEERLDDALKGLHYDAAVVCSVVPRVADVLRNWLTRPSHFLSCDSRLGVGIDYPSPRQIGADRLANAAGAVAYYGYPCIVVDFGTAVTFDVIGPERTYLGGAIAPGLASMGDYLARNTALLPAIEPHEPKHAIGTSTVEAMHSGARVRLPRHGEGNSGEAGRGNGEASHGGGYRRRCGPDCPGSAAHRPCGPGYYAERPADGCRA